MTEASERTTSVHHSFMIVAPVQTCQFGICRPFSVVHRLCVQYDELQFFFYQGLGLGQNVKWLLEKGQTNIT